MPANYQSNTPQASEVKVLYRGSGPSAQNASSGGVNRPLTNEEIDKNFWALWNYKLEHETDTLATVTGRGASTSTNLSMTGANTLGTTSNTTTIAGPLTIQSSIKASGNSGLNIKGGDITGDMGYSSQISGGDRTGAAPNFSDGAGDLIVKGGDLITGNGPNNSAGNLYLYGGQLEIGNGYGGAVHIVSGSFNNSNTGTKISGDVLIDVAKAGYNMAYTKGQIKIGTGAAYRAGSSADDSGVTITLGTSSGVINANGVVVTNDVQVNSTNGTTKGTIKFQDASSAAGSTTTYMLGYYDGSLLFRRQPFGGGTTVTMGSFASDNTFSVEGSIRATGDVISYYSSDITLKTNIVKITDALTKVNSLDGVTFNWNDLAKERYNRDTTVREAGIIAQQVQENLPEVVKCREDGTLAVDYEKMVPLLIEAIKELTGKVEDLQNQLNNK